LRKSSKYNRQYPNGQLKLYLIASREGLEATKDVPEQLQTFKDVETERLQARKPSRFKSTASEKSRWSMIRISEHGESGSKGEVGKDQQGRGDRQEHRAESTNSN
jgi:hypothetical protein